MPQLWLTYDELAETLGCNPVEARSTVVRQAWTRKHSSDGLTRVLLPRDEMLAWCRRLAIECAPPARAGYAPLWRRAS